MNAVIVACGITYGKDLAHDKRSLKLVIPSRRCEESALFAPRLEGIYAISGFLASSE